jgi:hypothetical protein
VKRLAAVLDLAREAERFCTLRLEEASHVRVMRARPLLVERERLIAATPAGVVEFALAEIERVNGKRPDVVCAGDVLRAPHPASGQARAASDWTSEADEFVRALAAGTIGAADFAA